MNGRWKLKGKLRHYTFSLFVYVHDLDSRECVCIIPSCLGRAHINLSWFLHYSEFRCRCHNCDTELLSNALEFRCCKEVTAAMAKLTFEGIKGNCVLHHPDFDALKNATVLEQVCPLMKDKKGRAYKFPTRGIQKGVSTFFFYVYKTSPHFRQADRANVNEVHLLEYIKVAYKLGCCRIFPVWFDQDQLHFNSNNAPILFAISK